MKTKKALYLSAAMVLGLGLVACGGKGKNSSSKDESSYYLPGAGSIINNKANFEDALNGDYSNVTVHYAQVYADETYQEEAYEYYVNGFTVVDDYTAASMGYTGMYRYSIYHDYQGDNYAYWVKDNGYVYDGWVANGYRDADLGIYNAYFSIPHLLDAISVDDVEYILGAWYVKASKINEINAKAFEFYGDPMVGGEDLTAIAFILGEDGRFEKIIGSVSDNSDDGVEILFENYGTTTSPISLPEAPNGSNCYTYAEMKGDSYIPDVYAESLSIALNGEHKSDATHDLVLDIDESVDCVLTINPENTNIMNYTWLSTDADVASTDYKENWTSKHKYISGVGTGEAEIYVAYLLKDGSYIYSNHLKVKVNAAAEINKENAVYDLTITGSEDKEDPGDGSDYMSDPAFTKVFAANGISTTANYTITGHGITTLEAKNTDSFGNDGLVLVAQPSAAKFMNYGFYSAVDFDFGDQEVSGLSFYYALHKSNQKNDAIKLLSEAYISTSSDGETWSDPIDMKEEMVDEFGKINLNYLSNLKIMSRTFAKATKVRLYFKSNMVGGNLNLCMNSFVFYHDETCHDHTDFVEVPVTGVTIASSTTSIKEGATSQLFVSNIAPENATNKNVTWKTSDSTIATISETGLLTAVKAGAVEVYAVAANGVESNKITFTITGQEFLPESVLGTYLADDLVIGLKYYDLKVEILDTTSAKVTLTPETGDALVYDFTYDTYDEENKSIAPYVFKGTAGSLKMKIVDNNAEVYLKTAEVELGNTHIWEGEAVKKYIAATSIALTKGGKFVSSMELIAGGSDGVTATVGPSTAYYTDVTATSSDETVATVEKNGNYFTVKAVAAGSATITFKNKDGVTTTLPVTVKAETLVSSITLTAEKTTLNQGEATTITTTLNEGVTKKNLSYTSSNTSVVTVNHNKVSGVVTITAVGAGTATITCKDAETGVTGTIDITVTAAAAAVPSKLVGTFSGCDDLSNVVTLTVKSDGTGTITIGEYSCGISLQSSTSGEYTFKTTDNAHTLVVNITASYPILTVDGGDYDEENYWWVDEVSLDE